MYKKMKPIEIEQWENASFCLRYGYAYEFQKKIVKHLNSGLKLILEDGQAFPFYQIKGG
jgi:hypothetical protein